VQPLVYSTMPDTVSAVKVPARNGSLTIERGPMIVLNEKLIQKYKDVTIDYDEMPNTD